MVLSVKVTRWGFPSLGIPAWRIFPSQPRKRVENFRGNVITQPET